MLFGRISDEGFRRIAQVANFEPELTELPVNEIFASEAPGNQQEDRLDWMRERMEEAGGWPEEFAPISVRPRYPQFGPGYTVLNGNHRLRTAKEFGLETIPVRLFPDSKTFDAWAASGNNPDK